MLKISKQLDVLLCHLETQFNYSTVSLEPGWYQIKRDKEMYEIFSFKDFSKPIQVFSSIEMPELTKKVFVHLLNDGYYEEEDIVENVVPQRKLKLA
jgi:hypothetical protein